MPERLIITVLMHSTCVNSWKIELTIVFFYKSSISYLINANHFGEINLSENIVSFMGTHTHILDVKISR